MESSLFARLASVAAATHDSVQGEAFEFRPMKHAADRNAPTIVDPDRAVKEAVAVWVDYAARGHAGAFHQPGVTPERGGHSSSRSSISLDLSLLPWTLRQGDQVFRKATQKLYRVFEVLPSTPGFVRVTLNA